MEESHGTGGHTLQEIQARRRRNRIVRVLLIVGLLLLLGGAAAYFFGASTKLPWETVEDPIAGAEPDRAAPTPMRLPPAPEPEAPVAENAAVDRPESLPALDESDGWVRGLVAGISSRPEVAKWLANDDLVRRFVVMVDNVAEGRSPRKRIPFLGPEGTFQTEETDGVVTGTPGNYARYDPLVGIVTALDAEGCAALFRRLQPLFDRAYEEQGYPDGRFVEVLHAAASELLSTPRVEGEPELDFYINRYLYADPDLEDLSPAQKHLLRMGPRNVKRLQDKVLEIAEAVGIERAALPTPGTHRVAAE